MVVILGPTLALLCQSTGVSLRLSPLTQRMIDLHFFFFGTTLHFPTRSATEIHFQLLMVESEEEIRGPKSVRVERTNSVEEGNDALTDGGG